MPYDSHGPLHLHRRKRIHQKHEPYPHPDKFKRFYDKFILFFGIIGPLLAIPQLVKIWIEQNAAGVSLFSWIAFLCIATSWLVYGIIHKEKPIIVSNIIWIIVDILIIIGIFIYG